MSTDDSISEDVSSSGALSHCHASGDGEGGKGSETSLLSSEATSASGLAVSEDRHTASHTTGGTVQRRPAGITPACNNIRSDCCEHTDAYWKNKGNSEELFSEVMLKQFSCKSKVLPELLQ